MVVHARHAGRHRVPFQHLPELAPLPPRLLDVAADSWGVIVIIRDNAPKVFKLFDRFKHLAIRGDRVALIGDAGTCPLKEDLLRSEIHPCY